MLLNISLIYRNENILKKLGEEKIMENIKDRKSGHENRIANKCHQLENFARF